MAKVPHEGYIYEGAVHGFNCDATPERYNKAAADLAWQRTIDWFNKYGGFLNNAPANGIRGISKRATTDASYLLRGFCIPARGGRRLVPLRRSARPRPDANNAQRNPSIDVRHVGVIGIFCHSSPTLWW